MKVTFFSGTASTSTVEAPQIIAAGLADAEKAQLLSEINEQARALIYEAATTAAVSVAPAAADAIRAQVSADADRAEAAAAAVPQKAMEYAVQTSASLPSRPPSQVVHWLTWSNPSAIMRPYDLWFQQPQPTVPDMPAEASWSFDNARTGTSAMLRILEVPDTSPPLTGLEYQIDGGTWVSIPVAVGDISIPGLTDGQTYGLALRYRNFKGPGVPTVARTMTVSADPFRDSFDRADQNLSADARYLDVLTGNNGRKLAIRSNVVQGAGTNETYVVQIKEYFAPDQYVEAQVLKTGVSTTRGVMLYVRMPNGKNSGYRLRMAGTIWALSRIVDGVTTTLASGTFANALPVTARLAAQARVITASIGGTVVATVTDNDPAAFLSGTVGIAVNASSQDGANSVQFDNLVAGNV